jgi:hypothetical protein
MSLNRACSPERLLLLKHLLLDLRLLLQLLYSPVALQLSLSCVIACRSWSSTSRG